MIYKSEKAIPGNDPTVEFNIVHTTGIGPDVLAWLIETFGHTHEGRWFIINRSIYFKFEKDYVWFQLRWSNRAVYRRA